MSAIARLFAPAALFTPMAWAPAAMQTKTGTYQRTSTTTPQDDLWLGGFTTCAGGPASAAELACLGQLGAQIRTFFGRIFSR